ncbi:phage minor head protein [Bacteroidota bacterium]
MKYFEDKGLRSTESYKDYQRYIEYNIFTSAGVMKLDILEDLYNEVDKALSQGVGIEQFKRNIRYNLVKKGWLGQKEGEILTTPWRANLIYRQNLQTSFMSGRYKQMVENSASRPYWKYVGILDDNTRKEHAKLQNYFKNKVLHYSHPFWKVYYPPNGFYCRCRVQAYTEAEAKQMGWKVYKIPVKKPKIVIDENFAYNPALSHYRPDLKGYDKRLGDIIKQYIKELNKIAAAKS